VHHHKSLREHLDELAARGHQPVFEVTEDPTLVAFAALFDGSGLVAFDANKRLRTDAWSPIYDCWTESQRTPTATVERFDATWAPIWGRTDRLAGFRTGRDSALLGTTPTVAMPQDERTAALLMLVTTTFLHLSADRDGAQLTVRGAMESSGSRFRYVMLDAAALGPGTAPAPACATSKRTVRPGT
jgi:hypothetical protein